MKYSRLYILIIGLILLGVNSLIYLKPELVINKQKLRYQQFAPYNTHVNCPSEFIDFSFCKRVGSTIEHLILGDSMQLGFDFEKSLSLGAGSCPLLTGIETPNSFFKCKLLSEHIVHILKDLRHVRVVSLIHRSEYLDYQSTDHYLNALTELVTAIRADIPAAEINLILEPPRFSKSVPTCVRRYDILGTRCDVSYPDVYNVRSNILKNWSKTYNNIKLVAVKQSALKDYENLIYCFKDEVHFISKCQFTLYGDIL